MQDQFDRGELSAGPLGLGERTTAKPRSGSWILVSLAPWMGRTADQDTWSGSYGNQLARPLGLGGRLIVRPCAPMVMLLCRGERGRFPQMPVANRVQNLVTRSSYLRLQYIKVLLCHRDWIVEVVTTEWGHGVLQSTSR